MIITLKNGNKMEVENGKKLSEIAKEISEGLAREAVVAKVNGELKDLSEELNAEFVKQAAEKDIVSIKGHRLVGGMRASIYNAMPVEGVKALIEFMKEFEVKNK